MPYDKATDEVAQAFLLGKNNFTIVMASCFWTQERLQAFANKARHAVAGNSDETHTILGSVGRDPQQTNPGTPIPLPGEQYKYNEHVYTPYDRQALHATPAPKP